MNRLLRICIALVFAIAALCVPSTAMAADGIVVRQVDTSNHPNVKLDIVPPAGARDSDVVTVEENGQRIDNVQVSTVRDAGKPLGIVLVLDNSSAMTQGDAITKVKNAASDMVRGRLPNEQIALVAINSGPRLLVNFTEDSSLLLSAIDNLRATGDPALWDGLTMAANLLADRPDLQPNVIAVSGAADNSSKADAAEARSSLRTSKALLLAATISQGNPVNASELQQIADATSGRYLDTTDAAATEEILLGLQETLREQLVISYATAGEPRALDITVGIGSAETTIHASPGTIAAGAEAAPEVVQRSKVSGIFEGWFGIVLIGLISLACILLLLYGIIEIIGNERNQLSRRLSHYAEGDKKTDTSKFADSQLVRKAVERTGQLANDRGWLVVVEQRLEQAALPLRPAEAIFFTAAAALVAMLIGFLFFRIIGLALAGLIFAYLPIVITNSLGKRRRSKFNSQLPDTLQLLSGSMRAGLSLAQGMDAVAKQSEAPMGVELQRAMSEARLGRPIDEALAEVATRMGSKDFEWAVMAIRIQREVGGNLSELLLTVSETMVERERLRREVQTLTAEGRISALVLVGLPPSIGVLISIMNPTYMQPLLTSTLGQLALVVAAVMMGVGYWLMTKLIEIEA